MGTNLQRKYKCLPQQVFINGNYKLIPIRDEDKYAIMQWRNEQIEILRQKEVLTKEKQELYFSAVVNKLFEQEKPDQLLFSFLENDQLIGYGGLVHIDWESKNAEISFITATERNTMGSEFNQIHGLNQMGCGSKFISDFNCYLTMIINIAYNFLNFNKLHTTFYDMPSRYFYKQCIEDFNFIKEAHLKNHLFLKEKLIDVFIYAHFKNSNQ